ncbi:MAG: PAS domain-containing protein [Thermomicrobium sp.]|nr:PAS domain-containing protein [Thermomicrobium sp.]
MHGATTTTMTILLRLDATGRIVAAQPAGSVPVGHSVLDLAPPTERQRIDGLLARARGGEPAWGDATLALDGQERRYRLAIVPGELGTSAWLLSPLSGTDGIPWEDERELERWLGAFLVEQVEIGALVFDAIGTLRYRNRTAVRLLGADQLPVGSALATVAGQLADCCAQGEPIAVLLREAFAEGRPLRQVELERHDGIVLELDFVPVHDEGRLTAGVLRLRDITARRRSERRAAAAEARYRELVELLPVVVYRAPADAIAETSYVSPQIERLLGYSAEEWLAVPGMWARHLYPDDRARVVAAIEQAIADGRGFSLEYRMVRRDGSIVWVQDWGRLQIDERGGRFVHGVMLDITERKLAEQARAEAEERLAALVEAIPAIIYVVDATPTLAPDGTPTYPIRYVNEHFETLTGYPVSALYERPALYAELIHPDDRARYAREALRTDETGELFDLEYRLIRRDGAVLWVRERAVLLRDQDGRPVAWQGLTIDITAQKQAELALREAEERFRLLAEHHPGAVTIVEPEPVALPDGTYGWRTIYASPRIVDFTGYTAVEWSELGVWMRGIHPDDRERVLEEARRWYTEGPAGPLEYRFRRKDGRLVWLRQDGALVRDRDGRPRYLYLITLDITAERELLEQVRLAEERYRTLVEQLPGAVLIRPLLPDEAAFRTAPPNPYVSPAIERLTGFTAEEWTNDRFLAQLHPEDRERVLATVFESDRTGAPISIEYRLLRKDGSVVWVWSVSHVIRAADGTPLYRQVLLMDITERKQAELALREAEARYRALVEQLPGAVIVRSGLASEPGGRLRIHYVSPSIERLTGFTPEEWREPGRWSGQLHPDDRERVLAAMHESERTGAPLDLEYRYVRKDGRVVWLWHLARVIHDAEGRPAQRQVLLMDITERKQAELALREAEARYRALVEQLPGAVLIRTASSELQPDGTRRYTFHYVSPGIEQLTGFTPDEWLVPGTWTRQMHPEDRERVLAAMLASEAAGAPLDIEYRLFRKDGSLVWIWHRTEIIRDAEGRPLYRQVLLTDITARKEAEEALRAAEAHYRTLVEQLPAAVVRVAAYAERLPDGVPGYETSYVSPQIEDITGFTPEEWKRPGIWARQLHPEDRERVLQEVWRHEPTGEPLRLEYRFQRKDGETVWLWHEVRAIRSPDGTIGGRQAILMDITERKRIEEALRAAEERFRTLVEQIPAALVILEPRAEWLPDGLPGYRTHYASPRILDLTGYAPEEWEQLGVLARSTHPDDRPALLEFLGHVERTGEPGRLEYRFVRKDGQLAWHRLEIWPIRTPDGSVLQWHALLLDVTREKEAERALREAEERYRNLVEQLPAVVYVEGVAPVRYPNGRLDRPLVYVSPQIEQLTGHTPEEHQRDRTLWIRAIHPDDYQRVRRETREAWATGRFHSEFRIVHADGSVRWLESTARLVRDADGKPLYWQGVMLDVTERKRIEEELQEAEERYRTLVEQIPAAVIVTSATPVVLPDGTLHYPVTYLSPRIEEVTGFSREEFEATPGLWFSRMHPDDQPRVFAEAVRTDETGESFQVTYRFQRKDGRWVWLENRAVMMRDAHGHPLFWHGLLIDVTERKRTEELLVAQTTLLRLIAEAAPLSEVLERLCRLVEAQAPGLLCSVLLLDSEGRLRHAAAPSLPPEAIATIDGVRIGPEVGSCGTAAYLNQPVYVADTRTDPRWARYRGLAERFGFRACWSTPIRDATGTVLGTVALYATEPRAPRPEEERLLELATQLAALALERWRESEELRHRAFHDPLTGLPNRLLFLDRLEHAIARAERDGGLAVLFVDLDDFKRINDTWGHGAGDLVLQEVARRLARSVRASDTVARFAGDEFTVLLEGVSDPNEVRGVAERLIAALAEPIDFEVAAARVSLSVGAAFGVGSPLPDSGTLLLAADQALYAAKRRGKCCAELVVLGRTARSTEPADAP